MDLILLVRRTAVTWHESTHAWRDEEFKLFMQSNDSTCTLYDVIMRFNSDTCKESYKFYNIM